MSSPFAHRTDEIVEWIHSSGQKYRRGGRAPGSRRKHDAPAPRSNSSIVGCPWLMYFSAADMDVTSPNSKRFDGQSGIWVGKGWPSPSGPEVARIIGPDQSDPLSTSAYSRLLEIVLWPVPKRSPLKDVRALVNRDRSNSVLDRGTISSCSSGNNQGRRRDVRCESPGLELVSQQPSHRNVGILDGRDLLKAVIRSDQNETRDGPSTRHVNGNTAAQRLRPIISIFGCFAWTSSKKTNGVRE